MSSPNPIALLSERSRRAEALASIIPGLGWPSANPVAGGRLVEVVSGGEPQVVFADHDGPARAVSLAYTRESPYLVAFTDGRVQLHASRRWQRAAGDSPLADAALEDRSDVAELLDLVRRERVTIDAPSDLHSSGIDHRPLHDILGAALRALRFQVAEAEAYRGDAPRDTAVLRLAPDIVRTNR